MSKKTYIVLLVVIATLLIFICSHHFSGIFSSQPASTAWLNRGIFSTQPASTARVNRGVTSTAPGDKMNLEGIHQDNPLLVEYLKTNIIKSPPTMGQLKLDKPEKTHFSQLGQDKKIDGLLKQRQNGFFIEVGAANGELHSNGLFFERARNWTGILIEADPGQYKQLLGKNRRTYSVGGCLSMKPVTQKLDIQIGGQGSTFVDQGRHKDIKRTHVVTIQCYPLWAILQAIGRTHVDLFSLDVEGAEVDVLKTIPFDKVTFDVLTIEWHRWGDSKAVTLAHRQDIAKVMNSTGQYRKVDEASGLDDIYMNIKLLG